MSFPCRRFCSDMFRLILQGENLDSAMGGWIRWHRRLSVAPFFKTLLLKNLVVCMVSWYVSCRYGHCYSLLIAGWVALGYFLFPRRCIALVLYDFVICRHFLCMRVVDVDCVHSSYAETGRVFIMFVPSLRFILSQQNLPFINNLLGSVRNTLTDGAGCINHSCNFKN